MKLVNTVVVSTVLLAAQASYANSSAMVSD